MATILSLKLRAVKDAIILPVRMIRDGLEGDGGSQEAFLRRLAGAIESPMAHDKRILEQIVNWIPEGGLPLIETAKWFKLAMRIIDIDETRQGPFVLSDYQVQLLWSRLIDPRFKIMLLSNAFVEFIVDFQIAVGRHFPEEEPDESGAAA